MGDLQGPKIRVYTFKYNKIQLAVGDKFTLESVPTRHVSEGVVTYSKRHNAARMLFRLLPSSGLMLAL